MEECCDKACHTFIFDRMESKTPIVVRSVEDKLARVDTVVRTLLEKVKVVKEDDLR